MIKLFAVLIQDNQLFVISCQSSYYLLRDLSWIANSFNLGTDIFFKVLVCFRISYRFIVRFILNVVLMSRLITLIEMWMFKIVSNPKMVTFWYIVFPGSKATTNLDLVSKTSLQEQLFNTKLNFHYYYFFIHLSICLFYFIFNVISLKTMTWKKKCSSFFSFEFF